MRTLGKAELERALDVAIKDRLCVQAWLGYANTLFVGFGDTVMVSPEPRERHQIPPYEVHLDQCDWWVEGPMGELGRSDEARATAEATACLLVGQRAMRWRLDGPSFLLSIGFERDMWLRMAPYPGNGKDGTAWHIRMQDGSRRVVDWNGTITFRESE